MKNKEAFEKWWVNFPYLPLEKNEWSDSKHAKLGWEACEQHYESRRCDNCKHYLFPKGHGRICSEVDIDNAEKDFWCKHYEGKK